MVHMRHPVPTWRDEACAREGRWPKAVNLCATHTETRSLNAFSLSLAGAVPPWEWVEPWCAPCAACSRPDFEAFALEPSLSTIVDTVSEG